MQAQLTSALAGNAAPASTAAAAGGVNHALIPNLGATAGKNHDSTGNCDGAVKSANGAPIKVPCACPPDTATFAAVSCPNQIKVAGVDIVFQALSQNVAAGHAVNNPSIAVAFPTGSDNNSQAQRIQAALVTLQNLHGPGKGCPASSTTLSVSNSVFLTELDTHSDSLYLVATYRHSEEAPRDCT